MLEEDESTPVVEDEYVPGEMEDNTGT